MAPESCYLFIIIIRIKGTVVNKRNEQTDKQKLQYKKCSGAGEKQVRLTTKYTE